jgi:hypothetical protein
MSVQGLVEAVLSIHREKWQYRQKRCFLNKVLLCIENFSDICAPTVKTLTIAK